MRLSTGPAISLLLAGLLVAASAAPAAAHHKPGHSGGPGSNCPAPQQKYPPGQCNPRAASVSDASTTRGQPIRWFGQGYAPNTLVTLTMFSTPTFLGTTRADAFSFAERIVTIPADATVGNHRIVSTGLGADGRPLTLTVPITVTASGRGATVDLPDTGPEGAGGAGSGGAGSGAGNGIVDLPRTGAEIAVVTALGLLLVGTGTAAVVAGRRRRTELA